MKRSLLLLALAALTAPGALADDVLQYGYLEVDYVDVELDGGPDGDGFDLGLSFEVGESIYLFGGFGELDFDGLESSTWGVGIGGHSPIGERASFFAEVGYIDAEVDTGLFGTLEDEGWGAAAGVRGLLADEKVELNGAIEHVDLGDAGDDTSFRAGVRFNVTRAFSLGASFTTSDDSDAISLGARFYFD